VDLTILRMTGGPWPNWAVARVAQELYEREGRFARAGGITVADKAWLLARSDELARLRSPETAELVDLTRASLADKLANYDNPKPSADVLDRIAAQNDRMGALIDELWPDRNAGLRRSIGRNDPARH
jgi:hypothetical protein